jgi:YD repeat-containing protein
MNTRSLLSRKSTTALMLTLTLCTYFPNQVFAGTINGTSDNSDSCGNGGGGGDSAASRSTSSSSSGSSAGFSNCKVCSGGKGSGGGSGSNSGGTGGSGSGCKTCPKGMAIWEVSEPFINVFLYDEPISYQPGLGPEMSFKLTYKQRETRKSYTGYFGSYTGIGPNWHFSWASYLYRNSTISGGTTNYDGTATVVLPDGGERTFVGDGATTEFFSHGILTPTTNLDGSWKSATIVYPDASMEVYSNIVRVLPGLPTYPFLFLMARYDSFGNATKFNWSQVTYPGDAVRLFTVVDADGRTNTLSYNSANLITSIQDPFGRTATMLYDSTGRLTNITDPESISSSFSYNSSGSVTNLYTPYGNTAFEYLDNGFGVLSGPIRAVRVDDAAGGTNVYMLTQINSLDFSSLQTPSTPPFSYTLCAGHKDYRDSFHWGPRQSEGLPVNMNSFSASDLIRARIRHWLHDTNTYYSTNMDYANGYGGISQIVDFEIDPSPDGVNFGQATFYDYDDSHCPYIGSNSLPAFVARVLPDTSTWITQYQRDEYGRATNVVDSYSGGFGYIPSYRTNLYVYNGDDLVAHYGPNGNLEDSYGYNGKHQLTYYTNAVQDVTSYTYDAFGRLTGTHTPTGLTTTNIYFTSGDYTNFLQPPSTWKLPAPTHTRGRPTWSPLTPTSAA